MAERRRNKNAVLLRFFFYVLLKLRPIISFLSICTGRNILSSGRSTLYFMTLSIRLLPLVPTSEKATREDIGPFNNMFNPFEAEL